MKSNDELNWAMQLLNTDPEIIVLTSESFYHGDSYWYDTEFEDTIYPQNGFSVFLQFKTFERQYCFYRQFMQVKTKGTTKKPRYMQLTFKNIEKDIWLLQLKYRCRENINKELFAYWKDLIVALSQK